MGFAFLEFVFVLVALYLLTQIFLPMVLPIQFQYNWLFKKTKADKVEKLVNENERIKSEATELYTQTEKEIEEAEKQKEALKNLEK